MSAAGNRAKILVVGVAGEDAADVAVGGVAADAAVVAIEVAAAVEVEVGSPDLSDSDEVI